MSEKAEQAARAGEDFRTTFLRERIWLDEDLCSQLEDFNRKLYEAFVHFTTYPSDDPGTQREYREAWKKAWQTVDQDAPPLRKKIVSRFRQMLGVGDAAPRPEGETSAG